jgi:ATP-binding cassette, subfamily B, multidrug efflux pump
MTVQGMASVGIIAAFVTYSRQFFRPINQLSSLLNMFQSAIAGAERVFEIMDETPDLVDRKDARVISSLKGDVEFSHVHFSYEDGKPILKDIHFKARAGETIALVGPTGSGKTTIINLLMRFYDSDSGEITIDGENIKDYKISELRKKIGIVLQDTFLFSGTIMENIRYGRLEATDEEVIAAAKMASAHGYIKHLPKQYETRITSGGSNLSQGQRQLLAIARAILADSDILILDEATSSIDTRTEIEIQKGLNRLTEGRTSFVIAHRLKTIENADRILVIDRGEIIESGTHKELLQKKGFYYELYERQFNI